MILEENDMADYKLYGLGYRKEKQTKTCILYHRYCGKERKYIQINIGKSISLCCYTEDFSPAPITTQEIIIAMEKVNECMRKKP